MKNIILFFGLMVAVFFAKSQSIEQSLNSDKVQWKFYCQQQLQQLPLLSNGEDKGEVSNKKLLQLLQSHEAYPATIPGTIHLDLLANKLIPDPFYADNEKKLQWIDTLDWMYETTFDVDSNLFKQKHVELNFDGLDTYADVYLNDEKIISPENMFVNWNKEVKNNLKRKSNKLKIVFHSTLKEAKKLKAQFEKEHGYELPEGERVFVRKAQYQFGWDFAPKFLGCGIWKNVKLVGWSTFKINSLIFKSIKFMDSNLVKIKCSIDFDLNRLNCSDGTPRSYQLFLFVSSKNKIDTLIFSCNTSKSNFIGLDSFILENPNIWVIEKLKSPLFEKVHLNIKVYDFKIMKEVEYDLGVQDLAIRTLELVQQKDSIGESFYFKLNGKPVFVKGANWVPADVFLPRVSHEKYRNLLQAAKDANMNMLRVWGGGIYEDEYFYHLCDSLGIMVWQDLPFACSMYPIDSYIDSIPVIDSISGELLSYKAIQSRKFNEYDKISKNFISSFSIICGNNEIDESWKNWGWQQQYHYSKKDSTEIWNNYLSLFKRMIPLTLNEINSGIPYIPSSPKFGWGHPESLTNGDSHYWGVWWGMEPYEIYKKRVPRFASEYGMQSLPCLATIKKFAPDSSLRINSVAMRNHQKHPTGFENLDGYLKYYGFKVNGGYVKGRKVISEYGKGNPDEIDSTNRFVKFSKFDKSPTEKEFEAYINATQQLQADALRTAIEAHLKAQPRCMGTLIWQLNDCWPGASWSLIDYYGSKKKAYYEVQKLFKKAK